LGRRLAGGSAGPAGQPYRFFRDACGVGWGFFRGGAFYGGGPGPPFGGRVGRPSGPALPFFWDACGVGEGLFQGWGILWWGPGPPFGGRVGRPSGPALPFFRDACGVGVGAFSGAGHFMVGPWAAVRREGRPAQRASPTGFLGRLRRGGCFFSGALWGVLLNSDLVEWAGDAESVFAGGDVEVDFGGCDVFVTEEFLDGPEVDAVFEQVGGKGMSEGVAGDNFIDACGFCGAFDGFVVCRTEQMVPSCDAGFGVEGCLGCGEEPEPFEGFGSTAVFSGECDGDVDTCDAGLAVVLPCFSGDFNLPGDWFAEADGQDGDAVFVAFALSDGESATGGVDVLDAKADEFGESESCAVLELCGELVSGSV
jgi:hypothetical protein